MIANGTHLSLEGRQTAFDLQQASRDQGFTWWSACKLCGQNDFTHENNDNVGSNALHRYVWVRGSEPGC